MPNFKPNKIDQRTFLDVDFLEIIGTDTFEYCLYQLLEREHILQAFEAEYKNDHAGRKAYPPKVLMRITSSRVIALLCETDLKFMALAGGEKPHFATIAEFVSSKPEAIADVFQRVLLICDESGLIGKEHFAIDGCLMKQKIDSGEGACQNSCRMWTIEPVFANICSNKGLDKCGLRRKEKATGQWRLFAMVHNVEKLWRYGPQAQVA